MLNLHIGGTHPHPDWKIFNVQPGPNVDYVGNAADLSQFRDESVDKIYTSHTLEHFGISQVEDVLKEWYRVLKWGGELWAGVPDLKVLSKLLLLPNLSEQELNLIMAMMFGAQADEYDYHKMGFCFESLSSLLEKVGFATVYRVENFGLFPDCTTINYLGEAISLNMIAVK